MGYGGGAKTKKRPSQAARRTGSVRASMTNKKKKPMSKTAKARAAGQAANLGAWRASMPKKGNTSPKSLPAPKPKPKKARPNMIGRDVKTGKFVSLEETVKRPKGTVVEKFTPKAKKK